MITTSADLNTLDFALPTELEASAPPEARGLTRDQVRLMVSHYETDQVIHAPFYNLPQFLRAGDVLAINTSGTLNAALRVQRDDTTPLELHISTHLPADLWLVEARTIDGQSTQPFYDIRDGEVLILPDGGRAILHTPYARQRVAGTPPRLWVASLQLPLPLNQYLDRCGFPIRYNYVRESYPATYYQTIYVTEMGSAEMPSAGRAFTPELLAGLVANGVQIAPLILHTGVSSLESHEPPYEEYYRVPSTTAQVINAASQAGRRIIAVGTTVVRALETVATGDGLVHPGEGWTELVITPERGISIVNGLLTGFHEPRASHLAMLESLTGKAHLQITYREALRERYLWHEFGDLHLILP
ncbi:MAG: S-adenosylmethionine:tRNA ribosyltransferase-isomerase [Anaerolineae bacterium]